VAESFLGLSVADRVDALDVAAAASGRPAHLLEKDVWVVWALQTLFADPLGTHLVFKGGTSLSKVYGVIKRFSEDVDLTYDIRALVPDLLKDPTGAIPATRSQVTKVTNAVHDRLPVWIADRVLPLISAALATERLPAEANADGERLHIDYEPAREGTGYVAPRVLLEFGARSTGEPCAVHPVTCTAADHLVGLAFPHATPRVMSAERTFWEKATAIHVFCVQEKFRGTDRFARHWHDIVQLGEAGYTARAIADRGLARAVARHKSAFFAEKAPDGGVIDYFAATRGGLALVPTGVGRQALSDDYARMVDDGMLLEEEPEPFESLMERCGAIQEHANETGLREDGKHE